MKSSKRLIVILSMTICCGLFIFESEAKAQKNDKTELANLSAIKGKQRVYVFAQSVGAKNKIEQALKIDGKLEIANKPEDAEFFINESEDVKYSPENPPNLRYTLDRLSSPDMPQNQAQQKAINDASNPSKIRNAIVRKTTIQVYLLKGNGTKVIAWSKDMNSKISSTPQTTQPLNNSTDVVPEIPQYYKAKDDVGKLTKSLIRKIKDIN